MTPLRWTLRDVRFAASKGAVLPTSWDGALHGFKDFLDSRFVVGEPDLESADVFTSPAAVWREPRAFAVVADFDGDDGGMRLVVPEVRLRAFEHGFAVQWMFSPEALAAAGRLVGGVGGG